MFSTSKKPKQDDKEMIDVEGNNKRGAHEDEMQQPQNTLCKILLNPKPKLAKDKQKKRNQPTTLVQTAKLVMQTTQ
jgi:hypothetical protein